MLSHIMKIMIKTHLFALNLFQIFAKISKHFLALIVKNGERCSFFAHFLERERRSPRAHEIESGVLSAAHMSGAH